MRGRNSKNLHMKEKKYVHEVKKLIESVHKGKKIKESVHEGKNLKNMFLREKTSKNLFMTGKSKKVFFQKISLSVFNNLQFYTALSDSTLLLKHEGIIERKTSRVRLQKC